MTNGQNIPAPRSPQLPTHIGPVPGGRLRVAVDEARAIVCPEWQREAERRVAMALGPTLYERTLEADGLCDDIAEIAARLANLSPEGDRATERALTPRLLELLRNPGTAKLVTRNFAAQTVPAPSTSTVTLVNALRALGVLHCVQEGRDLTRCRCLWPLARHQHDRTIRNDVRMVVRFGLDRIPAAWMIIESAR